jgi:IPT/TIG domain-containing protein
MAVRFTHPEAPALASGDARAPTGGARVRRVAELGLLGALLSLPLAPTPVSASAPVHVYSVQPNAGPNTGGTTVTIQGSGFQGGAQVKFGGTPVAGSGITPTSMTAVSPSVASSYGAFPVEVDNPDTGRSPEQVFFNYYERLPDLGQVPASGVHAATHDLVNDAQLDVFITGNGDGALHHTFNTNVRPTWSPWENLGGVLTSAPSAVSWGNQNRIDVFARGSDYGLWHAWWDGTRWGGWEPLGGVLNSDPAVTSWGSGRLDVFAAGQDGGLWHRFYAGSWSEWEPLGGQMIASPGSVSWGPNRIDIFVQGLDHAVWHKWWNGAWGGWESLAGGISQSPDVASTGVGDLEVYALGAAQNLYHAPYFGGWRAWRAEGQFWNGNWVYGPGVVSQGFVLGVDTFEVGSDRAVWHTVTSAAAPPHAQVRSGGPSATNPRAPR